MSHVWQLSRIRNALRDPHSAHVTSNLEPATSLNFDGDIIPKRLSYVRESVDVLLSLLATMTSAKQLRNEVFR